MYWSPVICPYLLQENYQVVSKFYEELIEAEPKIILHYWLLGLAYLLEGREAQAESTWLSILTEVEDTAEFSEILDTEATRQKEQGHLETSLLIREYLQEISPKLVNNQLEIVLLSLELKNLSLEPVIASLAETQPGLVNFSLLLAVLTAVLEYPTLETVQLVKASLPHLENPERFIEIAEPITARMAYQNRQAIYSADLTELFLQLYPNNITLLNNLYGYYCLSLNHQKAKETLDKFIAYSTTKDLKLRGEYLNLDWHLKLGKWLEIASIVQNYKTFLTDFCQFPPKVLEPLVREVLPVITLPLLYLQDDPRETRFYQNSLSRLFQENLKNYLSIASLVKPSKSLTTRNLKIGYIAHTLKRHSVGWLSRWLFKYHNKEKFTIYLYLVNQEQDDLTLEWFCKNAHQVHHLPENGKFIFEQIFSDKIDILIDLDSLTKSTVCEVMALKPAPIQITWLGMDATGIPNVDYFIVDPYVVPENAQEYYQEKLWRLPQTYLAVSGFEVAVPTLTREDLKIPKEAIIYLTSQTAYKRHPENIRLQLKILKAVPNSYLLIKGGADLKTIEKLFNQLAVEEKVEVERLRYYSKDPTEEIHRANLSIADIVLDTYPYNGATTTLEVLWMGIPLVTLVGEQFAARNSYTFMLNAGITEGIAFNQLSYLEWGIRLGLEEELRASIHWKLLKNRQTSPLWNAQQFTQEMEKAYQQMWNNL